MSSPGDPWKPIFEACGVTPDPWDDPRFLPAGAKRVLALCRGGNSRSVACAFLLKYKYNLDALACGWEKNTKWTISCLCNWANMVIVMEEDYLKYLPTIVGQQKKARVIDVGADVWVNGLHPELIALVDKKLKETGVLEELLGGSAAKVGGSGS